MWGQERLQYSTSKTKKDIKSGCMVDGESLFSPCKSGSPTPVLCFDIAKDHFSPKHKGACELPASTHQQEHPVIRFMLPKAKFLFCTASLLTDFKIREATTVDTLGSVSRGDMPKTSLKSCPVFPVPSASQICSLTVQLDHLNVKDVHEV